MKDFCYGKVVQPVHVTPWYCGSFENDSEIGYVKEVGGSGRDASVCVEVRPAPYYARSCSSGPSQGAYLTLPEPVFGEGWIENHNSNVSNKVYGFADFVPEEETPPPPPPSWHYEELSGEFLDKPSISSTGNEHLNIFVRGLDGNLWQRWWEGAGWGGWQNISEIVGGPISSGPGAVSMNSTRVDVVARMPNNTVGHWWYDGAWHYEDLSGEILGDPEIVSAAPGHLNIFVRGLDGNLWQKWWEGAGWSGWQNVSSIIGGPIASSPGATSALPDSLTVVARKPNNHVGVWSWINSAWNYQELSGEIMGDPDDASTGSAHVNVFAQGLDQALWQQWTTGIGWSPWQPLSISPIESSPAAVAPNLERVDVVARSATGNVGHWWYGR